MFSQFKLSDLRYCVIMGCCATAISQQLTTSLILGYDSEESVTDESQTYTSEADELLVHGWIRENVNDKIPNELMNECLISYKNNKGIRPDIQCIECREDLTKQQFEIINSVLIGCYKENHSFIELISSIRDKLNEYGMTAVITERALATYVWNDDHDLRHFRGTAWKVGEYNIRIWGSQPKPKIDTISCIDQGTMNQKQCDVIKRVLECCSLNNEMCPSSIGEQLAKEGMSTIVIAGVKMYWKDSFVDEMLWSRLGSAKHGDYLILMSKCMINQVDNTNIVCKYKGILEQMKVIAETL